MLADSSVVTLALPDILREFDAQVSEVAWVLTAFNLVLALAAVPAARWTRRRSGVALIAGLVVFAIASGLCAAAPSLPGTDREPLPAGARRRGDRHRRRSSSWWRWNAPTSARSRSGERPESRARRSARRSAAC